MENGSAFTIDQLLYPCAYSLPLCNATWPCPKALGQLITPRACARGKTICQQNIGCKQKASGSVASCALERAINSEYLSATPFDHTHYRRTHTRTHRNRSAAPVWQASPMCREPQPKCSMVQARLVRFINFKLIYSSIALYSRTGDVYVLYQRSLISRIERSLALVLLPSTRRRHYPSHVKGYIQSQ